MQAEEDQNCPLHVYRQCKNLLSSMHHFSELYPTVRIAAVECIQKAIDFTCHTVHGIDHASRRRQLTSLWNGSVHHTGQCCVGPPSAAAHRKGAAALQPRSASRSAWPPTAGAASRTTALTIQLLICRDPADRRRCVHAAAKPAEAAVLSFNQPGPAASA